jgi:heme oxygenase
VPNETQPAAASRTPEILSRLRAATREFHHDTERALDLPASIGGKADYVRLLQALWTFYDALETRLEAIDGLDGALPDWPERRKSQLLAADLANLGAEPPRANGTTSAALAGLADLNDLAAAFGALYVVEGATLGGAVVGPRIQATLAGAGGAFAFYGCYGARIGPRWRTFVAALSREASSSAAAPGAIVSGACRTFEVFLEHVSRECVPPRGRARVPESTTPA